MAPADEDELADMMALVGLSGTRLYPLSPWFCCGSAGQRRSRSIASWESQRLQPIGDIEIWAIGNMVAEAEKLSASLSGMGFLRES